MTTALMKSETTAIDIYSPDAIASTLQMAKMLVQSKLTPRGVDSPEKAFYIIMKGRELGVPPIRSLERIHIIEGKCTMAAELMLERFRQRGGHSNWIESTSKKAVLHLKAPNGDEHTEEFTWDDAVAAGVTNKDNWRKWPKAMLRARCSSAALRAMGEAEGMYDPDELGAVTDEEGQVLAVMPTPKAFQPDVQPDVDTRSMSKRMSVKSVSLSVPIAASATSNVAAAIESNTTTDTAHDPKAPPVPTVDRIPGEDDDEATSSVGATCEPVHDPTTGEVLDEESDEEDLTDVVPVHAFNERTQEWEPHVRNEPKLSPAQLKRIQVLRGKIGHHLDSIETDGGIGLAKKKTRVKDGKYRKVMQELFGKVHTNELSRREASIMLDRLEGMWERLDKKLDRGNEGLERRPGEEG